MNDGGAGQGVECVVRPARESDVPLLLTLVRELAVYEDLAAHVVADEALMRGNLFGDRVWAEALIAETPVDGDEPAAVGFALWSHSFSSFLARPTLFLEDLYVRPAARGRGVGQTLLARLAAIAIERGCGRMEWSVLEWNDPAIDFYRRLQAAPLDDWTNFRLTGDALHRLATSIVGET